MSCPRAQTCGTRVRPLITAPSPTLLSHHHCGNDNGPCAKGAPVAVGAAPAAIETRDRARWGMLGLAWLLYFSFGLAAASLAALALTNSLAVPLAGSWRRALEAYGALGVLIAAAWLLLGRARDVPTGRRRRMSPVRMRDIAGHRAVVLIIVIGFAGFLSSHGIRNWLPQVFETKGMTAAGAGWLAAVPSLTGIAGSVVILRLVATRGHRTLTIALLATTAASLAAIPFSAGLPAIAVIAVYGFCAGAYTPLLLNALMEVPEVGARAMGAAAGLYFAVGEVGGFLGPTLLGTLADGTGSFTTGLLLLAAVVGLMLLPAFRLEQPGD